MGLAAWADDQLLSRGGNLVVKAVLQQELHTQTGGTAPRASKKGGLSEAQGQDRSHVGGATVLPTTANKDRFQAPLWKYSNSTLQDVG